MTKNIPRPLNIFFSYAHEDEALQKELEKQLSLLERQNFISSWHDRDIKAGTEWEYEIDTHLNDAEIILLLISPDFIASDYCYSIEMRRALEKHEAGEAAVIPILLRPVDWTNAPFSKLQALPTKARPITRWRNRDEAFLDVIKGIRRIVEDLNIKSTAGSSLHQTFQNIPYRRNRFFTGREEILTSLHNILASNKATVLTQAISGLGGIGKTQAAVEYAYRYLDNYDTILWVKGDTQEALISDLSGIAELLRLPEKNEKDQNLIVKAVKQWLSTHSNWLLILDNVENLEMVNELIPQLGNGHVLITTRLQAVSTVAQKIEIDIMQPEAGALFVLRRANIVPSDTSFEKVLVTDRDKAQEISRSMGGLPLALDQSGAYIEETGCGLSDYLTLYETHRAELLKQRGKLAFAHPESVTTTFSLSFEKIRSANLAAAELLQFCAFLYPDNIPEEFITKGSFYLSPSLQAIADNPLALNRAIGELHGYSLIHRDSRSRSFNIHRLVQAVLIDMMDETTQHQWAQRTIRVVNNAFPEVEFTTWQHCQRCLPHALSCSVFIKNWSIESVEAARLLFQAASYLQRRGQYSQSKPLQEHALQIREKVLGPEHPDTAASLSQLGWALYSQGKLIEAKQFAEQALEIRKKTLGLKHPDIAASLSQLAVFYRRQGNGRKAEQLNQQALEIYKQARFLEHSDAAYVLQNLASLYLDEKKYPQAELYSRQALKIREEVIGLEHPDTMYSLNQLARLCRFQHKYSQADSLFQRALKIGEKVLGPSHPNVAFTLNNLAALYRSQGKYHQAEPLYQRALTIYEQTTGPTSSDVVITLNQLAELYRSQRKYQQAEPLYQRVLTIYEHNLGLESLDVAVTLNRLAELYRSQRKYQQAEPLYQRALTIYEHNLGLESLDVARVLEHYADLFRNTGREIQAKELEDRAEEIKAKILMQKDPQIH